MSFFDPGTKEAWFTMLLFALKILPNREYGSI
jgi:hypothetical protein